jgi:hypothetical protein
MDIFCCCFKTNSDENDIPPTATTAQTEGENKTQIELVTPDETSTADEENYAGMDVNERIAARKAKHKKDFSLYVKTCFLNLSEYC